MGCRLSAQEPTAAQPFEQFWVTPDFGIYSDPVPTATRDFPSGLGFMAKSKFPERTRYLRLAGEDRRRGRYDIDPGLL
jgi:hypothetical protein